MASSNASGDEAPSPLLAPVPALDPHHDPFITTTSPLSSSRHRFSNFDSQLFALGPNASPAQAKRALEAHLAETDRRMEEAGKLGTALVQQRKELSERLVEVEKLEAEGELSDDLRQKLIDIEKDYNEVAKESARAFLPKQRVPSNEAAAGSPFVPEGKGGRRSVSPSKFEGQATGSPSKFSVPNRKVRNQPANRIHDIEFAAEISTSLIAQVRNLQGLLAEKEEELREIRAERSKLEYEVESFQQRVKNLDESEHRYKDENWNLETQVHDLLAKERETLDREKKLAQSLNILQAEKSKAQRELDEVKVNYARLTDEYAAAVKQHDIELGTTKRSLVIADAERASLRRRIDDLTGQNQELAKAVSASQRARIIERESILGMGEGDPEDAHDRSTPEHSPPPSPVKGTTPRHSMLESETLKTSLGHAQRTIQGLRSNVHREKTEKLELRRMLQEARDEIEKLRSEPPPPTRRARKAESKEFKKVARLLGGLRTIRSDFFSEDSSWEDQPDSASPTRSSLRSRGSSTFKSLPDETEIFEPAQETSDAAFETANEPEPPTETDDFHTGAEDFSSEDDEDAETETDSPTKRRTPRNRQPTFSGLVRSGSLHSTASTEDEEDYPFGQGARTPTMLPALQPRFPLRVGRGVLRRPRAISEDPSFHSSPPSLANSSVTGTPRQHVQSLAAELGDFDASDNESNLSGTPGRRSIRGRTTSPLPPVPPLPRVLMIDSGTMTDGFLGSSPSSNASVIGPSVPFSARDGGASLLSASSSYNSATQNMNENLARFPSPPTSPPARELGPAANISRSAVPQPNAVAAEIAALKAEHQKTLDELSTEKAAAYNAALEELKTQHVEQLAKLRSEASDAHLQEINHLKSSHTDEVSRAIANVEATHTRDLEALRLSHSEEISKSAADARDARAREIETLTSNHAEEINKAISETRAAHSRQLESLQLSHADEISEAIAKARAVHAQEIEELRSSFVDQEAKITADSQAAHAQELDALKADFVEKLSQKELDIKAAHNAELESLTSSHVEQIAARESAIKSAHAVELDTLKANHASELTALKTSGDARFAAETASLAAAHSNEIDCLKNELSDTHVKELENLKSDHTKQLDLAMQRSDEAHAQELESLKATYLQQVEEVRVSLATAHTEELNAVNAAHAAYVETLKKDFEAQHTIGISALAASHSKELESIKAAAEATLVKELAALKEKHALEIDSLNSQHAATRAKELGAFKAAIDKQVESSKTEGDAAHTQQIEALNAAHAEVLEAQKRDSEKSQLQAIESLKAAHERRIEALMSENTVARSKELEGAVSAHLEELEALKKEHETARAQALEGLAAAHYQQIEEIRQDHLKAIASLKTEFESSNASEIAALNAKHTHDLGVLKSDHGAALSAKLHELSTRHTQELDSLRQENDQAKLAALASLSAAHASEIESLRARHEEAQSQRLQELAGDHSRELERLRQESDRAKSIALAALAASHAEELKVLQTQRDESQSQALETLRASHSEQLAQLKIDADAALSRELEAARVVHANILESHKKDSAEEIERLVAIHAAELEALRKSLARPAPALGISELKAVETEPAVRSESSAVTREGRPKTPTSSAIGFFGRKGKKIPTPEIAEDDTRQSPSATPGPETPESQQPFKEISTNIDVRLSRKQATDTADQSSQTALTSDGLEQLIKHQDVATLDPVKIATVRGDVAATTPSGEAKGKPRSGDTVVASAPESISARRPDSSASARGSAANRPPLPSHHRETIEAARTNSLGGGKGSMGPPALPASAFRGPGSRPDTPSSRRPLSPTSAKGTPTLRAGRHSVAGSADMHHSQKQPAPSRQSSVSSFVSEVDTRFNNPSEMGMDVTSLGTDPRMIQAITQTMIGEYMWKYTRKAGRGGMSENRHRRYFWVHPYTRTLYWSNGHPSAASRSELKTKSIPIEAVHIVGDNNVMPPGLHQKSLVIKSPGRTVKLTCTTGQRHETWFNALSYLLLRTGDENQAETEDGTLPVTQEDVDEFNPSASRRPAPSTRTRPPPSLSSFNSRTIRTDSPQLDMSMSIPTLTPTRERELARSGTMGRLSGYWRTSTLGGTFSSLSSLRSRSHIPHESIYEASEVRDSAEDVRQIIEQQDRESDRLENVRACCDGKHDVGTLSHTKRGGRVSNAHSQLGRSTTPTPAGTLRSRA
ncbi:hypothetical protein GGS23DRAFT_204222 [Durotheca rogersii]|uniref:uncharacterized protein n=1 Tax=Durotheca rogersii TaxID=419775 RepID=UPI0022201B6C|nr:uncharacterized protein GGS23DRAFT_204222 [Durotheca rogersii]KAI5860992.1 hypothetical protein GGS23DRAFT_204222 [Durotheca rogersii]